MIVGMFIFLQTDAMDQSLADKKMPEVIEESEVVRPNVEMIRNINNQNAAEESGHLLAEVLGGRRHEVFHEHASIYI